jgi:hypothetical protein
VGNTKRPYPVLLSYVGKTPLYEALATAAELDPKTVMGRRCRIFRFENVLWGTMRQHHEYAIDVESALPLMLEAFDVQNGSRCLWQWAATRIGSYDGHRVADESTLTAYSLAEPDRRTVRMTTSSRITSLEFNAKSPDSTFRMVPEGGTLVYNQDKQTFTKTPSRHKQAAHVAPPMSIGLPAVDDAGGQTRRNLAVGGGLALVAAVGAFLYRRSQGAG